MITIDAALYGSIAKYNGGKHIARVDVELPVGSTIKDFFTQLGIPSDETGFIFINAVLCDMPGLAASKEEVLHDGDHLGVFALGYMWPYQYRDGMPMTESLKDAMRQHGALHHAYKK